MRNVVCHNNYILIVTHNHTKAIIFYHISAILSTKKTTQKVVGFCAESENLIENAREKIRKKGCDYLIANDISRKDIGFSSDYNEVVIFDKNGGQKRIERAPKNIIARKILEEIYE